MDKKKAKKRFGISALACAAGVLIFAVIGSQIYMTNMTPEERKAYETRIQEQNTQKATEKAEKEKAKKAEAEKIEAEKAAQERAEKAKEKETATPVITESITEHEHVWQEVSRVEPTEESEGISNQECSICGETQTASVPKLEHTVPFKEIFYAYQNNELNADDLYKGNRYAITCTIYAIGDGGLNGLFGDISVSAYTYVDGKQCILWCTFDEKTQRQGIAAISMGDTITFEGTCLSWGNWSNCERR